MDRPIAILLGPATVTDCEKLILDGRSSYGLGAWQPSDHHVFKLISLVYGGEEYITRPSDLPGPAVWKVNLGTDLGSWADDTHTFMTIAGNTMLTGASYTFQLIVKNGLNKPSLPVTLNVTKVSTPLPYQWQPTLTIVPPLTLTRSQAHTWSYRVSPNGCSNIPDDAVISYEWAWTRVFGPDTGSSDPHSPTPFSATTQHGSLPAYSLVANATYEIQLMLIITSMSENIDSSNPLRVEASIQQHVTRSPLVALISGSSRIRSIARKNVLDGSISYDPDVDPATSTSPAFKYEWSCSSNGAPTPLLTSADSWFQPALQISAYTLQAGYTYTFTLTIRPIDPADTRSASASRQIVALPDGGGGEPFVQIIHPPSVISAEARLTLQALAVPRTALRPEKLTYLWECDSSSDVQAQALAAVGEAGLTNSSLNLPPGLMAAGSWVKWQVTVRDTSNNMKSTAFVRLYVEPLPDGGVCSVTPQYPKALDELTISCTGFHSPIAKEPLSYSYRYLDRLSGSAVEHQLSLMDHDPSPVASFYFPAEVFKVRVYVSDSKDQVSTLDVPVAISSPNGLEADGLTCFAYSTARGKAYKELQQTGDLQGQYIYITQLGLYLSEAAKTFGDVESVAACSLQAGIRDPAGIREKTLGALLQDLIQLAKISPAGMASARMQWRALVALTADTTNVAKLIQTNTALVSDLETMVRDSIARLMPTEFDIQMAFNAETSPYTDLVTAIEQLVTITSDCSRVSSLIDAMASLLNALGSKDHAVTQAASPAIHSTAIAVTTEQTQIAISRGSMIDGATNEAPHSKVTIPASIVALAMLKNANLPSEGFDSASTAASIRLFHLHSLSFSLNLLSRCFPVAAEQTDFGTAMSIHSSPLVAVRTSVDGFVSRDEDRQIELNAQASQVQVLTPQLADNDGDTDVADPHAQSHSERSTLSHSALNLAVLVPRGDLFQYSVELDPWVSTMASMPYSQILCGNGTVRLVDEPDMSLQDTLPRGITCVRWDVASAAWTSTGCAALNLTADHSSVLCTCSMAMSGSMNTDTPEKVAPTTYSATYRLPILQNGSCDPAIVGWDYPGFWSPPQGIKDPNGTDTSGSVLLLEASTPWFYIFCGVLYGGVALTSLMQFYRFGSSLPHGHPFRRWFLLSTHVLIFIVASYRVCNMAVLYSALFYTYVSLTFATAFPQLFTLWCFILAAMTMSRASRKMQRNIIIADHDKVYQEECAKAEQLDDETATAKQMNKLRIEHAFRMLEVRRVLHKSPHFEYIQRTLMSLHVRFAVLSLVCSIIVLGLLLWATGSGDGEDGDGMGGLMIRVGQFAEVVLVLVGCFYYWRFIVTERSAVSRTSAAVLTKHRLAAMEAAKEAQRTQSIPSIRVSKEGDDAEAEARAQAEAEAEAAQRAELAEMAARQARLNRATFEQSEPFLSSAAFTITGPNQALVIVCLSVTSLILAYCAAVDDPGVGFVNSKYGNYAYLVFDIATFILLLHWLHRTVVLPDDDDEAKNANKYDAFRSKYQPSAEVMAEMQMLGMSMGLPAGENPLMHQATMMNFMRQGSMFTPSYNRQASGFVDPSQFMRRSTFGELHRQMTLSRQSQAAMAALARGQAMQMDNNALIMTRGGKPLHASPTARNRSTSNPLSPEFMASTPMSLPHVPEHVDFGLLDPLAIGPAAMSDDGEGVEMSDMISVQRSPVMHPKTPSMLGKGRPFETVAEEEATTQSEASKTSSTSDDEHAALNSTADVSDSPSNATQNRRHLLSPKVVPKRFNMSPIMKGALPAAVAPEPSPESMATLAIPPAAGMNSASSSDWSDGESDAETTKAEAAKAAEAKAKAEEEAAKAKEAERKAQQAIATAKRIASAKILALKKAKSAAAQRLAAQKEKEMAEAEEKAKAKAKAEAEAKAKAKAEAEAAAEKAKAEEEAKLKAEADEEARRKAEAEEQAEKTRLEAEAKAKAEAEAEAEAAAKAAEEARLKAEAEAKAKSEAEAAEAARLDAERLRREEEERAAAEAEAAEKARLAEEAAKSEQAAAAELDRELSHSVAPTPREPSPPSEPSPAPSDSSSSSSTPDPPSGNEVPEYARAPSSGIDGSRNSGGAESPSHEPDAVDPARFEIVNGERQPIQRVDEHGRPVEIRAGRRATINRQASTTERGVVQYQQGSADAIVGPQYKARTKEDVDAEVVGSLFLSSSPQHKPAPSPTPKIDLPKMIVAPTPTHGRRAGAQGSGTHPHHSISSSSTTPPSDAHLSSRMNMLAAAAKWKAANGRAKPKPDMSFPEFPEKVIPPKPKPPKAFGSSSRRDV